MGSLLYLRLAVGLKPHEAHLVASLHEAQTAPDFALVVWIATSSITISKVSVIGRWRNHANLRKVALPLGLNWGLYGICPHLLGILFVGSVWLVLTGDSRRQGALIIIRGQP